MKEEKGLIKNVLENVDINEAIKEFIDRKSDV